MFLIVTCAVFITIQESAMAATLPLPSVDIILKSIANSQIISANTDNSGNFNVRVQEENGVYDLYVGNESLPPIKISARKNVVSGRIVILTEGTTTKDLVSIPATKKITPAKKPTVIKKSSPAVNTTKPKLP